MTRHEFGKMIIAALENDPEEWRMESHNAYYKGVGLWIANRPYADLTIHWIFNLETKKWDEQTNRERAGTFWQRHKIRKLMDGLRKGDLDRAASTILTASLRTPERGEGKAA